MDIVVARKERGNREGGGVGKQKEYKCFNGFENLMFGQKSGLFYVNI